MSPTPLDTLTIKDKELKQVLQGKRYLVQDGAMGTMLQKQNLLAGGELPELLNLTHPEAIKKIHEAYVSAGAEMITTNTFGANAKKLDGKASVEEIFQAAIKLARAAGARYVGADIGPLGIMLEPMGSLSFEEAYDLFTEQVIAAEKHGADIITIETMSDLLEIKAAVLAAKENSTLPIFASMTFAEDGRTFLGTSPQAAAITLDALGAHIISANCSLGPDELLKIAQQLAEGTSRPLGIRPNAGLPRMIENETVFDVSPEQFSKSVKKIIDAGVSILGGCCGTDPRYIETLRVLTQGKIPPLRPSLAWDLGITGARDSLCLMKGSPSLTIVGERINPNGKKHIKESLRIGNYDSIIEEALAQQEAGAAILDVNVGLPDIDEENVLVAVIKHLQTITTLPLQIDSSNVRAIEAAARIYTGKPLINSVNGTQESMNAILPLAARYGCAIVGLTLDEKGIPQTAQERLVIARRITEAAQEHGIAPSDIVIDCLVLTAATNQQEVLETIKAVRLVKEELGLRTTLGVSNVSFGLPAREVINATFLATSCGAGLDLPIIDPLASSYRNTIQSFRVLNAQDEGAQEFISLYTNYQEVPSLVCANTASAKENHSFVQETSPSEFSEVHQLVIAGQKSSMEKITRDLLEDYEVLEIIDRAFIPALDIVGNMYESGKIFLPQMMASAEAVKIGFDVLKEQQNSAENTVKKSICLATVKGDVHDIGKNIVAMLLENYGYHIIDLGRDVDPLAVVDTVKKNDISLVGLSALMTTTVHAMEETISLLRQQTPWCKIIVGGAVLSPEYAQKIGADYYAKDAAESARIAALHFSEAKADSQ